MKRVLALALWVAVFQAVAGQPQPGDSAYIPAKDEFLPLDREAKALNLPEVMPRILMAAQTQGVHAGGMVVLRFLVSPSGSTLQHVVLSNSDSVWAGFVIQASTNLKWQPGVMNGKPVHSWKSLPFIFRLPPSKKEGYKRHPGDTSYVPAMDEKLEVDVEPMALNMDEVKRMIGYPPEAISRGISGDVVIRVLVSPEGKIVRHVVVSDAHKLLIKSVLSNLYQLVFSPAIVDRKFVYYWSTVPFKFDILKGNVKLRFGN